MTNVSITIALGLGSMCAAALIARPALADRAPELLDVSNRSPINGGAANGIECVFDNYFPLDDFGSPASQVERVYPFYAEAADDFMLPGAGDNLCLLEEVVFAVSFFNTPASPTPQACWESVIVTVYEDIGAATNNGDPARCPETVGPAGWPDDADLPVIHHEDCLFQINGVRCAFKVPMEQVQTTALNLPCVPNAYEVRLTDLPTVGSCFFEKNRTYWVAISPVMPIADCGQTAIMYSQTSSGEPAMQFFELLNIMPWAIVGGNAGACDPEAYPAGAARDLAFSIITSKVLPCPNDLNNDGAINAADLAIVLGAWGVCEKGEACPADLDDDGEVGASDLAILLGSWESCP